jgi:hypothetical protein
MAGRGRGSGGRAFWAISAHTADGLCNRWRAHASGGLGFFGRELLGSLAFLPRYALYGNRSNDQSAE